MQDNKAAIEETFEDYIQNTRDEFTSFINAFEWRTDLRTHIESLLIAYDQMREKLSSPVQGISKEGDLRQALMKIIAEEEKQYQFNKDEADWFNNNTPYVGQTIDYKTYPPLPEWVKEIKELLASQTEEEKVFTLQQALEIFRSGKLKGHWVGRLAILSLPGCNYQNGAYMKDAVEINEKTPDEREYFSENFGIDI